MAAAIETPCHDWHGSFFHVVTQSGSSVRRIETGFYFGTLSWPMPLGS